MDIQRFVKLAVGREWLAVDENEMYTWVESRSEDLSPKSRRLLLADLKGRKIPDIAADEGMRQGAVWKQIGSAIKILGGMMQNEQVPLKSVFDHEFSQTVDWVELATCLYGKASRSLFWYMKKASNGEIDLPIPEMVGSGYVWTKEQAEEWRRFYVEGG